MPVYKRQNKSHLSNFKISLFPKEKAQFLIKRETTSWYTVYFGIKLETLPSKAYMLMGNLIEMSIIALTFTYKIANLDKIEAEVLASNNEKERYRTLLRALMRNAKTGDKPAQEDSDKIVDLKISPVSISEVLENMKNDQQSNPSLGTMGEHGEGNGLIITKSFLELFSGRMKIEKQEVGTLVSLIFPK